MCNKHIVFAKGGVEYLIELSVAFSRACFFVPQFFRSLVPRKKHSLRLVEIELFVQFSPPFANTFSVSGKAMTTQPDRQNRVLFDILYFSSCLNKQIDYLCAMDNISCIRQQADIKQINRCKDRVSELNGSFDYLSNGLELAGNNVRLKILFLLYEEKRLCVCDISDILGMTISAVSQHLRKLKDRKLIVTEREAQTIFYSLTKEYEKMLKPFFKILDENKILETL